MVCDLLVTSLVSCEDIPSPPSLHTTLVLKNDLSPIGHPFNPWAESSDLKNQTQDLFLFQLPRKWHAHLVEDCSIKGKEVARVCVCVCVWRVCLCVYIQTSYLLAGDTR